MYWYFLSDAEILQSTIRQVAECYDPGFFPENLCSEGFNVGHMSSRGSFEGFLHNIIINYQLRGIVHHNFYTIPIHWKNSEWPTGAFVRLCDASKMIDFQDV